MIKVSCVILQNDNKITFVNSQHKTTNSKNYFVVKNPVINASFKDFRYTK